MADEHPAMQSWKTLKKEELLTVGDGRFLRVQQHKIQLPDGKVISDWPWLVMPDYVNVVAVTNAGEFLVFRQTKNAIKGSALAIVGG